MIAFLFLLDIDILHNLQFTDTVANWNHSIKHYFHIYIYIYIHVVTTCPGHAGVPQGSQGG